MAVDAGTGGEVVLPEPATGPFVLLARRLLVAAAILLGVALVVLADSDGYRDAAGGPLSFLDALYYSTVTLSTTGYGDIAPVSPGARLVNTLVVAPARVAFLIILVGTTLEVLTQRTRSLVRLNRWRSRLRDHSVVIGFGTKGRSAVRTLLDDGTPAAQVVVVDPSPAVVREATALGVAGVVGDSTRSEVLLRAEVTTARQVVVTVQRDDTAVLAVLTARSLNPEATIVVAVREAENAALLRQSGADTVITSSDAAGRMLALATASPSVVTVVEDLLSPGSGLELVERAVVAREVGRPPSALPETVLGVVRDGRVHHANDPGCVQLLAGDRVVVVRLPVPEHAADALPAPEDVAEG